MSVYEPSIVVCSPGPHVMWPNAFEGLSYMARDVDAQTKLSISHCRFRDAVRWITSVEKA